MFKKILSVFFISVILMLPVHLPSQAAGDFLPAHIAMDRNSGQVIISRDGENQSDASLLYKLMICLLAVENPSDAFTAKVSGEECTFTDLVKLSLLADNHEATAALSDYLVQKTGSLNVFLDKKIKDFNLEGTFFNENASEDISNSYTTLKDVGKFVIEANKNAEFSTLFCSQVVLSSDRTLISNTNQLVISAANSRIVGGSTATYQSGEETNTSMCYLGSIVSSVDESPLDVVIVVDSDPTYSYYKIGNNVIERLTKEFFSVCPVKKDDVLLTVSVGTENLDIVAAEDVECIVSEEINPSDLNISYVLSDEKDFDSIELPVTKGQLLGVANISLPDGNIISTPIAAGADVYAGNSGINSIIRTILSNNAIMIILIVLVALELMLLILNLYKKHNSK